MPTPKKAAAPKKAPRRTTKAAAPPRARSTRAEPAQPVGIAAKRAQMKGADGPHTDPYAPTAWSSDETGRLFDLELPSGQLVLAQRPGPQGLMAAGLLDDLDMLATILPKVMGGKSSKRAAEFDPTALLRSPGMMRQAIRLIDRVVVHVVIKPELTEEPEDPSEKVTGKIYPSSVSLDDKSFIFNWAVGGTRDLAKFRDEYEESVAGVEPGEDVEDETV